MDSVTVILLFTDIQGSTTRWEQDRNAMAEAVRRHDELLNAVFTASRGRVFKTMGDAFCVAFSTASDAVVAAREAQRALAAHDWSDVGGLDIRVAIHAGSVESRDGDYFGPALNKVARLLGIGHGGQVLLSNAIADLVSGELSDELQLDYLGRHRLKDLEGLEHVYQLRAPELRADFPPLRSLEEFPNNLPLQLTSFIGRENELARLRETAEKQRLLSLVGTGGVGKTRMALQLANESLSHYPDGVWLVDLSLTTDPDAVASETASTLSVRPSANQKATDAIATAIRGKSMLLIFDGCEQVVHATAELVNWILRSCPEARVLVTSRQALGIAGESVHDVGTLDTPPAEATSSDEVRTYSAVQLLVERSKAASNRFALTDENAAAVAHICRRLDGIPLALELAAPKMVVLSPRQLSAKLDELFRMIAGTSPERSPRQQTLRALIDWSFDLLDEQERAVFRRLAVFAGGWVLTAAQHVCEDQQIDAWQVLELLSSLVSKSLVVAELDGDEQRYRLLNSIREYCRERLAQADEETITSSKFALFYAAFIRELRPTVEAMEDVRWKQAVAPEIDNLRGALEWTVFRGHDPDVGIRLLAELEWPELVTTPQEAIRWFNAAARHLETLSDDLTKARFLRHYVRLEWLVGRPTAQREKTAAGSVDVARASGDPNEISLALANLATCYRDGGRLDEAEPLYAEAYQNPEALSAITLNTVLRNWAVTDVQRGEMDLARDRFTTVAQLERPGSEAHASALLNLGELEFAAGNIAAARQAAAQAKETFARLNAAPVALVVCNLAAYALAAGDLEEARILLREALQLLGRSGARWVITALEHHATLAGLHGEHETAAILVGFTDADYALSGNARQTTERHGYERLMRLLTQAYDPEDLARRMSVGARLTGEQALAYAAAISEPTPDKPAARTAK
ncbi:MAG: hypothetical protein DLM50_06495 [Candidatus Meridianibacter frigidus]|nr:MAG: hypothetical protein DLM50_06495 [Candidatus Eremiobacteraeota bacterium]